MIIAVAKELGKEIPILGVCLGHQAICAAFGATVTYAKELMHGKQSDASFDTEMPFIQGLPEKSTGSTVTIRLLQMRTRCLIA